MGETPIPASTGVFLPALKPLQVVSRDPITAPTMYSAESKDHGQYAGFWSRLGAFLLDTVVVTALLAAAIVLILWFKLLPKETLMTSGPLAVAIFIVVYVIILEGSPMQGTIGESIAGIVVTDLEGNQLSLFRSIYRFLLRPISLLLVVGYPMVAFTSRKQTLHDKIAGTLVIRYQHSRFWFSAILLLLLGGAGGFYAYKVWYPDMDWSVAFQRLRTGDFTVFIPPGPPPHIPPVPVPPPAPAATALQSSSSVDLESILHGAPDASSSSKKGGRKKQSESAATSSAATSAKKPASKSPKTH